MTSHPRDFTGAVSQKCANSGKMGETMGCILPFLLREPEGEPEEQPGRDIHGPEGVWQAVVMGSADYSPVPGALLHSRSLMPPLPPPLSVFVCSPARSTA